MSMKRCASVFTAGAFACLLAFAPSAISARLETAAQPSLRIISIDVEGGAATLFVTPQGHSVLIDTGWPAGMGGPRPAPGTVPTSPVPSSAQRIADAARAAGVTTLDYLIISHYHIDHIGGVLDLMALMSIKSFVDHGPNREAPPATASAAQLAYAPATLYPRYLAAIAGRKHLVLKAGQKLKLDDLVLTALTSDGVVIARAVQGAGSAGVDCAGVTTKDANGGEENPRSVGLLAQWGKARVLALADTTWNVENTLVCPINRIGHVDLLMVSHHGSDLSNSPALLKSVRPTAALMNNGPMKGGDGLVVERVTAVTGTAGLWQLHFADRTPDKNAPADQIANPDGPDSMATITVTVDKSSRFTVTNNRNGFTRSYGEAP
jgi:beta-lactamase superfamily II metal-dependent hydrolase